jgi:predicted DNA-binding transcriptional regulator AlpA
MRSFTIKEFCERQSIGRTFYYALEKQGKGPRTFTIGTCRRISEDAEREWVAKCEAATAGSAA